MREASRQHPEPGPSGFHPGRIYSRLLGPMNHIREPWLPLVPLGVGYYTAPEAGRLLHIPARNINRWLGGYRFSSKGHDVDMLPLWQPQLPRAEKHLELGFRDLIELRFVKAFLDAGLSLLTI